jgi:hypothetical protein
MTMPTRRAVRPDGRHIRDARRNAISHRGRASRRASAILIAAAIVGIAIVLYFALHH